LKLIVVHLEFIFLKKHNLGTLWDINSNSGKTFGFSDQGKDFRVKVHIELVVLWMTDYEGGLKTSFGLFNLSSPFLSPKVLE
jgi:hypothetical protein